MNEAISRRAFLKWGAITGAGLAFEGSFMRHLTYGALPPNSTCALPLDLEPMPTSPFILHPFKDPLPIPKALKRGWQPDPANPNQAKWTVRKARFLGPDDPIRYRRPRSCPAGSP